MILSLPTLPSHGSAHCQISCERHMALDVVIIQIEPPCNHCCQGQAASRRWHASSDSGLICVRLNEGKEGSHLCICLGLRICLSDKLHNASQPPHCINLDARRAHGHADRCFASLEIPNSCERLAATPPCLMKDPGRAGEAAHRCVSLLAVSHHPLEYCATRA